MGRLILLLPLVLMGCDQDSPITEDEELAVAKWLDDTAECNYTEDDAYIECFIKDEKAMTDPMSCLKLDTHRYTCPLYYGETPSRVGTFDVILGEDK